MFDCGARVVGLAIAGCFSLLAGPVFGEAGTDTVPAQPALRAPVEPTASPPPIPGSPARQLTETLKALEVEHGVAVVDPWGVTEGAEVTVGNLAGQSPEAVFRALLGQYELLFYYPATGPGSGRLAEIWVYPPGMLDRRSIGVQSGQDAAGVAEDTASRRAAMIEDAVMRDPAAAPEMVLRGLGDGSGTVRARTVAAAVGMGVPISRETLLEMMRSDPAEDVRLAVVDALAVSAAESPETLRELVELAERDPSPLVQARAAELAAMYASPVEVPGPESAPEMLEIPADAPLSSPLQPLEGAFSPPLQ